MGSQIAPSQSKTGHPSQPAPCHLLRPSSSRSRSVSLVGRDQPLFAQIQDSQMDPIDEDSVLEQFTASQMAAPSRYARSRYHRTDVESIAPADTIDNTSSAWAPQGQGKRQAQKSGFDPISSFETPDEDRQTQSAEVSARSKGSSRLRSALAGPLVLDDGEVPPWVGDDD